MYFLIQVCALTLLLFRGVKSECKDCVIYKDCPAAIHLANSEIQDKSKLLEKAFCGFNARNPKVCCSMLSIRDERSGNYEVQETPEDIRITNHENWKLIPEDCGDLKGYRISGGQIANLYEFPWMALISHNTDGALRFGCGGSIINKRYVLTAAHCVRNIAGVRVGEYDLSQDLDCENGACQSHIQDIPIEKSVVHEEFNAALRINDIALLRLEEDIDFDHPNVHRICLPRTSKQRHQDLSNVVATVAGWGINNGSFPDVIHKVQVPIFDPKKCDKTLHRDGNNENSLKSKKLCAGSEGKDTCRGDSGGPLILFENTTYTQYGIISYGSKKCDRHGIYVDVTKYVGWILDKISP